MGKEGARQFREQIYETYIQESDIARIAGLGFNCVRIPINHRVLEDDERPFVYKESGWKILDRSLDFRHDAAPCRHRCAVLIVAWLRGHVFNKTNASTGVVNRPQTVIAPHAGCP